MDALRKFWVGAGLLASAFSPLLVALVLVIRPLPELWQNVVVALVVALPALLPLAIVLAARHLPNERVTMRSATPKDSDVLAFIGSYLVPIAVAIFTPDPARLIAMAVLLLVLVAVYVGAELYWLNPLLTIAGFRIYQVVDDDNGSTLVLLTRRRKLATTAMVGGTQTALHVDGKPLAAGVLIELGTKR